MPLQAEILAVGTLILLVIVVFFIVIILIAVWVYRDAESRGMSGVLWLLVVLIANILGLIIYLIVREDKRPREVASRPYGYPPPQQPYQYAPPQKSANFCSSCGSPLDSGSKFCRNCGQRV